MSELVPCTVCRNRDWTGYGSCPVCGAKANIERLPGAAIETIFYYPNEVPSHWIATYRLGGVEALKELLRHESSE